MTQNIVALFVGIPVVVRVTNVELFGRLISLTKQTRAVDEAAPDLDPGHCLKQQALKRKEINHVLGHSVTDRACV